MILNTPYRVASVTDRPASHGLSTAYLVADGTQNGWLDITGPEVGGENGLKVGDVIRIRKFPDSDTQEQPS